MFSMFKKSPDPGEEILNNLIRRAARGETITMMEYLDAMEDLIAENIDAKALDKRVEEKVNDVADKARELAEAIGRKVSPEEVAREYEIDVEEVREAVRLSGYAIEDIETDEKKLT